jgi:putative DNA primase/helicase
MTPRNEPAPESPPLVTRYKIRDAAGELIAVHSRRDLADGGKQLWWEMPDGTKGLGGMPLSDLPLYGFEKLGDWPATVVIVEGEKAAAALVASGIPALGTVTGASSCPGPAVMAELTGRGPILWPDNDEVGRKHMDRVAASLADVVASVRVIDWPEAPEHGDAADFLAAGKTADDVRILIEDAQTLPLPTPDSEEGEAAPARVRRQPAESDRLIELAKEAGLFRTPAGQPFADVWVDGHRETWAISSRGFADWLSERYWSAGHGAPREAALRDATRSLAARARHGSPERNVYLRIGEFEGAIHIDLANEQWQAVEITADGWQVVAEPEMRFRRGGSSLSLPAPVRGGSIEEMRLFLNVADDAQWRLLVSWLVFAALPWGPYPPLILGGQQDSGKSTAARVLRSLIDPDEAPLTTAPRDDEDLIVTATNVWCPVYDNLSSLGPELSDMICRLCDGAGFQRRARYTDTEVVTIKARRPVIITGIGDIANRGDLLSRALTLTLPSLGDTSRIAESEFWSAFGAARPRILGALCDLIAGVLRELPGVVLAVQPRMADFARVGVALERVCAWPEGSFLAAYAGNRAAGHEITLDAYPIVDALADLVEEHPFDGPATELLKALDGQADEELRRRRLWPKSPNNLSTQLSRLAPSLGHRGLAVESREVRGRKTWRVAKIGVSDEASAPSAPLPRQDETACLDTANTNPERGADGGAGQAIRPAGVADPLAGPGADGAERVPIDHRHPGQAQTWAQSLAGQAQGADGADASSLNAQEERQDSDPTVAYVQAELDSGRLEGLAFELGPGVTVKDAAKLARTCLAELGRPGQVGGRARDRIRRLADVLPTAEGAP